MLGVVGVSTAEIVSVRDPCVQDQTGTQRKRSCHGKPAHSVPSPCDLNRDGSTYRILRRLLRWIGSKLVETSQTLGKRDQRRTPAKPAAVPLLSMVCSAGSGRLNRLRLHHPPPLIRAAVPYFAPDTCAAAALLCRSEGGYARPTLPLTARTPDHAAVSVVSAVSELGAVVQR